MKINFEDGSYVEFIADSVDSDKIYITVATRETPLKLNVNTADVTRAEFMALVNDLFKKE